ncbi:hypothetical protein Tco_1368791 [Tanacetum coccineum]
MKRVNTFVAMGSEVQESKEKKEEGREETAKGSRKKMLGRKRAGKEQQKESSKKQKVEEEKESEEVDEVELKKLLVIKKDEDIAIDAIPLATKLPVIVDYKLHKEGMLVHYQLIRADGSSKRYSSMIRMLQGIDREDLEALWRIVKAKYGDTRPENEFERVLYGDLKVMFEPDIKSDIWRMLQGYRVTIWKLIDSSGVHFVRRNLKIQKMNIKFRGGLLGLKRLHGFLEVTAAQCCWWKDFNCLKTFYCQEDKDELKRQESAREVLEPVVLTQEEFMQGMSHEPFQEEVIGTIFALLHYKTLPTIEYESSLIPGVKLDKALQMHELLQLALGMKLFYM